MEYNIDTLENCMSIYSPAKLRILLHPLTEITPKIQRVTESVKNVFLVENEQEGKLR